MALPGSRPEVSQHYEHPNFRPIEGTRLFRSTRLDNLRQDQLDKLHDLGVRCIIDLRSPSSWEGGSSLPDPKLIDYFYTAYEVNCSRGNIKKTPLYTEQQLKKFQPSPDVQPGVYGCRYYMNIIEKEFALGVAREAPWYRQVQLLGLGLTYYTLGSRTIIAKIPEWCLSKPGEAMMLSVYKGIVNYCGERIVTALRLLLDAENSPCVVTCMLGKDRTGLLSTLLQHICGVAQDSLVRGYTLTQEHLDAILPEMNQQMKESGFDETFCTANAETWEALLQYIQDRYGGLSKYLSNIGLADGELETLRKNICSA